jgi:signal transduction histidine kinase
MSSNAFAVLLLTVVLAGLIGLVVVTVLRFRNEARGAREPRDRLSEEAFIATAMQHARRQQAHAGSAPSAVPSADSSASWTRPRDEREFERAVSGRVSQLASGLAHELANGLTALHGYARMVDLASMSPADRASIEAVQEETQIMSDTLDAFRRIARVPELSRDLFELRHLVEDAVAQVELECQLPRGSIARVVPAAAVIDGDRVLLEEALSHMIRNAVEACRETDTVRTIAVTGGVESGRRVATITVSDRGPGVLVDDRGRLFEPFFTTKPKRAGFGLAFARHIVYAHDGSVATSFPDEGGLEVSMTLPAAVSSAPSRPTH